MTRALAHRGPDGEGVAIREHVGFGHRRLSIIDLSTGTQPMESSDGKALVTYNGEVYNYCELRDELEGLGFRFQTASDTEVVVNGYRAWGARCVEKFRGMFAFAAVDFETRRGLLARDPFGIKPLVYARRAQSLAFASEIQALLECSDPPEELDLDALELYLRFQYVPTPHTAFADVKKLGAGELVEFELDGRVGAPRRYFVPAFAPQPRSPVAALDEFERAFEESVRAHLVADVPYGVFLSGGVDSSLVALTVARESGRRIPAFVIDTGGESSEVRFARELADAYGLELVVEPVGELSLDLLPTLVRHFGEPFADSSALPTWHVARLARRHVPLALSGDGGDEFFGGYDRYSAWLAHRPRLRQRLAKATLNPGRDSASALARAALWRSGVTRTNVLDEFVSLVWSSGDLTRRALWRRTYRDKPWTHSEQHDRAARDGSGADPLTFAQLMDIETYLPDDILAKVDIMTMMHGLEVRPPMIDRKLFSFAASLEPGLRVRPDGPSSRTLKYLPKALLERRMPREFVHRRKQGFSVPVSEWFREGRAAHRLLSAELAAPDPRVRELFELNTVARVLAAHARGENHSAFLWSMLVLFTWFRGHPQARIPSLAA